MILPNYSFINGYYILKMVKFEEKRRGGPPFYSFRQVFGTFV